MHDTVNISSVESCIDFHELIMRITSKFKNEGTKQAALVVVSTLSGAVNYNYAWLRLNKQLHARHRVI